MDPLSELLSLLKPQSYASGGVALHQEMAIQWPEHAGIKCYAVVSGRCWLSVDGISEPLLLPGRRLLSSAAGAAFLPGDRA